MRRTALLFGILGLLAPDVVTQAGAAANGAEARWASPAIPPAPRWPS
jgi:hypothetical protein